MTSTETHKAEVLRRHPQVNVAYYNNKSREWVSVSGIATLTADPALIHESTKRTGRPGSAMKVASATGGQMIPAFC